MMSVIVFTTFALRIHQPWMYAFAMLFALATWVNVIYIGTHTAADVIVGWTGGLLVVLAYLALEHYSSPYFREGQRLDARYCATVSARGFVLFPLKYTLGCNGRPYKEHETGLTRLQRAMEAFITKALHRMMNYGDVLTQRTIND